MRNVSDILLTGLDSADIMDIWRLQFYDLADQGVHAREKLALWSRLLFHSNFEATYSGYL
jgi:hypothetical protein